MSTKIKTMILALCFTCTVAFAEQKAVVVNCRDGHAEIAELENYLRNGWRVVAATAVNDSDSVQAFGKPKQAYTATIVYIIERATP